MPSKQSIDHTPTDLARRAAERLADPADRIRVTVLPAPSVVAPLPTDRLRRRSGVLVERAWNGADEAAVARRVPAGDEYEEIGRDLGRSGDAVRRRALKLGVSRPRTDAWTPDLDARILSLRASGLTDVDIGRRVGRSGSAVMCRLSRLKEAGHHVGPSPKSRRVTEVEVDRVAVMTRDGRTPDDIAGALGKSTDLVRQRVTALRTEGRLPGGGAGEYEYGAVRRPRPGQDPLLAALQAGLGH